jgi:tetratricopeptide (TPR) repeat protein
LDQQSGNIIDYYQEIAICYKALGNHKEALAYQEKTIALKDKVYAEKVATLEEETFAK